jgi:hypothetical protein
MDKISEDISMELFEKVKQICMDASFAPKVEQSKPILKYVKKEQKSDELYTVITKMMSSMVKIPEKIIEELIEMLNKLGTNDEQTTNQTITTVKFYRLVLFNCTFYLSKHDSSGKYVFISFTKSLVDYLKRILTRFKDNMLNMNMDVLYNLCLNILTALAEPSNYAYQFKSVLKLAEYGFDLAEIKYLNDNFNQFLTYQEEDLEIAAGVESSMSMNDQFLNKILTLLY